MLHATATAPRPGTPSRAAAMFCTLAALAGGLAPTGSAAEHPSAPVAIDPFARFELPDEWEARFWAGADARALFALPPKKIADLVPTQAGVRFCRCPACDAEESDDPLRWSAAQPKHLRCARCGVEVPNDQYPNREEKKPAPDAPAVKVVAEEAVEVRPGVVHKYPYHAVDPLKQRYPDERLFLAAKADYEAREFLAKAALYAAVRDRETPPARRDPALARAACVLLVRFAQVYPFYATHYDQPASPKFFQPASLPPPYRRGFRTAKWDWSGSLDVPLNLVVAYALLRNHPAMAEAGRLLGEPDPHGKVERDLFRASAEFVRNQPAEVSEGELQAVRGLLAAGRVLTDPTLVRDAVARLDRLSERGFYHDGFWRQGTLAAHRRVVQQLDGWIELLLNGRVAGDGSSPAGVPMRALARSATAVVLAEPSSADVQLASWPAPDPGPARDRRAPALLGGLGLARLALGQGEDALDLELRSHDAFGPDRIVRQALRLAVGGRTVLSDRDDAPASPSGFERATVSRNTVIVDGLNQGESLAKAQEPSAGGNFLFFAAEPDFQVVTLDDPRAYPQSATRYRQTLVASAGGRTRYALAVFEVEGGLRHDQLFHAPAGGRTPWRLTVPTEPGPTTLLPPGLTFVPTARASDGRWFVQAMGELKPQARGTVERPAAAWWAEPSRPGVRLHLLGDTPLDAVTAAGPDEARPALVLRRRSDAGATLRSTFVTLFEPRTPAVPPLRRAGRVASPPGTVVIYVETDEGPEHLVVNLAPGMLRSVRLADGSPLTTDGLAVRVSARGALTLAGGTFAEASGRRVRQEPVVGQVVKSVRRASGDTLGWFETDVPVPRPDDLAGRTLIVAHGDGTTRAWTLHHAENASNSARLFVREEPGFEINPTTRSGRYYQFPNALVTGPHHYRVGRIARSADAPPPEVTAGRTRRAPRGRVR